VSSSPHAAHPSAVIDEPVTIGEGTRIWHFSHVMAHAAIGAHCSLGQGCFVASRVRIGDHVKVQNNVSIYEGTEIEDAVFLGPSCVLTNVTNPRSEIVRRSLYEKTLIRRGATIGANATVVCGVTVGRYAFVAAGSVVTKSVPDYALIAGVPGRRVGWMSRHAHRLRLERTGDVDTCKESGLRYGLTDEGVRCLDLDEDAPMPEQLARGAMAYRA
jgi:UDP-2-acetamido-3-amino-2,3-dideoxy-glucuronate N-acetyltransferase